MLRLRFAPSPTGYLHIGSARTLIGARLEADPEFTGQSVEAELRNLTAEKGANAGLLINGARAALTGQSVGPSALTVFICIGRDRVIGR